MTRRKLTTAERLTKHRLNSGMSRPEFAAKLGLTRRIVENAELGGIPRPSAAKILADELGGEVTDLWPSAR